MELALQNLPVIAAAVACTYAVYKLVRLAFADADLSLLVSAMLGEQARSWFGSILTKAVDALCDAHCRAWVTIKPMLSRTKWYGSPEQVKV